MPASGGSSEAEGRTIVLRNIGTLNEDDLRGTYKCLDSDKEVIERVFTLIDEEFCCFAERALKLDHGDIIVSRLPTQAELHPNLFPITYQLTSTIA
ncbi:hypothetical protein LSAT2_002861 [Lamellibrachia satsuma]|nr:hypothetical protein LSAT2_002861 [Lamellibrachia satsuma]